MKFTPRPYQRAMVEHMIDHPRCAVWAGMGLGKSVATLTALDAAHQVYGDVFPALVVAPKRVALSTWPAEGRKWDHLQHLRIVPIVGNTAERKRALAAPADVYTTNYEQLPYLLETWGARWPYGTLVADEASRLKSFRLRQGGVRASALAKVAHTKVRWFIELTGTPAGNGLGDLWGQLWFIDRGERLGMNYEAFKSRWFQSERVGADPFAVRLVPLVHAQAEISARVADVAQSLDAADWFDLAEPIMNVVKVELPAKARAFYDGMERELFVELDGMADVEAFSAASKTMKCLQLANGALYTDDSARAWHEVHHEKIDALRSIVEEGAGMPVLVAYQFKSDRARILDAFPGARHLDDDPRTVDDWNAGKIPLLVAHPASAGHGLNLQDGGNILAIFGHWWSLEEFQQIVERIGPVRQAQSGHRRPVFIHQIVAANTVDEVVVRSRTSKASVQQLLLDYVKAKRS